MFLNSKLMINKPFPAEHPYASHEERKAVFPKFDSPEDYKRGVDARRQKPKNDEMPSMPYDVTIVSKTKGMGYIWFETVMPLQSSNL